MSRTELERLVTGPAEGEQPEYGLTTGYLVKSAIPATSLLDNLRTLIRLLVTGALEVPPEFHAALVREGWKWSALLWSFGPDERLWRWWHGAPLGENECVVVIEIDGWPVGTADLDALLMVAGATSFTENVNARSLLLDAPESPVSD